MDGWVLDGWIELYSRVERIKLLTRKVNTYFTYFTNLHRHFISSPISMCLCVTLSFSLSDVCVCDVLEMINVNK